jgi:hypothetical protein
VKVSCSICGLVFAVLVTVIPGRLVVHACRAGMISGEQLADLLARQKRVLAAAAYEDVNLRGVHILLSYRPGGSFKTDAAGQFELRHCNFEFIRRLRGER